MNEKCEMTYEVSYYVGDGIYSVNMLQGARDDVFAEAEKHAKRYGYELCGVHPLTIAEAEERKAKGMPFEKVEKSS